MMWPRFGSMTPSKTWPLSWRPTSAPVSHSATATSSNWPASTSICSTSTRWIAFSDLFLFEIQTFGDYDVILKFSIYLTSSSIYRYFWRHPQFFYIFDVIFFENDDILKLFKIFLYIFLIKKFRSCPSPSQLPFFKPRMTMSPSSPWFAPWKLSRRKFSILFHFGCRKLLMSS